MGASFRRRGWLGRLPAFALLPGLWVSVPALAADAAYPSRLIRVVVPFAPGAPPDAVARLWAERLQKITGQPVIVDNRPGASTLIGTQSITTLPADGYTVLYTVSTTVSINPYVFGSLPYRVESLVPVSQVLAIPFVLVTGPSTGYTSAADLIAKAKGHPDKLNYASYGIGQAGHVAFVDLLNRTGAAMSHIPYKDGGLTDLMSGLVDASLVPSNTAIPLIRTRKLVALGVSTPGRMGLLPGVPSLSETAPGFAPVSWQGIFVLKGTPQPVVDRLGELARRIVADADFQARLVDLGMTPVGSGPEAFARFISADAASWAAVVRKNGIKAD